MSKLHSNQSDMSIKDFEYNCDNGCHHRDVVTKDCVCSCHVPEQSNQSVTPYPTMDHTTDKGKKTQ